MNAAFDEEDRPAIAGSSGDMVAEAGDFSSGEKQSALLFMLEDLERSQKQIEAAHQEWIAAVDAFHDPIFVHDKGYRIMRCNRAYAERAGMSFKAMIGKPYYEVFPKLDGPLPHCCKAMQEAEEEEEEEIRTAGGEVFASRSFSVRNKDGNYLYSLHVMEDITERKRAEEELRLRALLLDSTSDSIFVADFDGNFVYLNDAAWKTRGYTRDELMAMNLHALDTPEYAAIIEARIRELMENGYAVFESAHRCKDGSAMPIEVSARIIKSGDHKFILAGVRDITERKQAEKLLVEQEERLRGVFENTSSGVVIYRAVDGGADFEVTGFNSGAEKIEHISRESVLGKRVTEVFPGIREFGLLDVLSRVWRTGQAEHCSPKIYRDQRISGWRENHVFRLKQGDVVVVYEDITERKQSEQSLLKLNRAFRTLSAGNHELVHAGDEVQLLQAMCRIAVEIGGYSAAWVGYRQDDAGKNIHPMAQCGFDPGYADALQITWADSERGRGPTGKAVRSGMTQIVQDVAGDPDCTPWREQALKRGQASAIALPLSDDSGVFGVLTIYLAEAKAFDRDEVALLEEMADDLTFGIRMLRLRQEQQRHAEQVRKGLEGTVQAVAAMVEMRDPYTAGHQRRVADLAAAIALEMGLPEERAHGIHLAGSIHDLGKIQTPAEILSKPGRLSATEFSLIKDHPQNGHEILKDIEFPWPIAQMVLQHHERLDGSGYPQGLKGDEILPEARILAVADVVEAVSAHRPYRPGLGLEAALAEIGKGRGSHYDPDAVDACLRLFREKGFKFA